MKLFFEKFTFPGTWLYVLWEPSRHELGWSATVWRWLWPPNPSHWASGTNGSWTWCPPLNETFKLPRISNKIIKILFTWKDGVVQKEEETLAGSFHFFDQLGEDLRLRMTDEIDEFNQLLGRLRDVVDLLRHQFESIRNPNLNNRKNQHRLIKNFS